MRTKIAILATLGALILPASAGANYQLIFGYAKRAIARQTAAVCAQVTGCQSWSVKPCRRTSLHRIDCLANYFFREGVTCSQVTFAVLPPWASDVILHHKRIIC